MARCIDQCPGATRVAAKGCAEVAVSERDACYQTRDISRTAIAVVVALFLGVLGFGFVALRNGTLAH